MNKATRLLVSGTLPVAMLIASCSSEASVDRAGETQSTPAPAQGEEVSASTASEFRTESFGSFNEPWAAAFAPGTSVLFITEKPGTMKFVDTESGRTGTVTGLPDVDYGGQGGLGDVAFLPSEASPTLDRRTIYLSWAEAGEGDTRGAAVGRGTLICEQAEACRIEGLNVIWRQQPKVTGRGHYSHRIAFSPDERYMFVASGDRQKMEPAQDLSNTLGTIVRLNLDGSPAEGNPFAERGSPSDEIWSYGHRNTLGLQFDPLGQLWNMEHGPQGGDELNRIERGQNYGWPIVSNGIHYSGEPIPDHSTRPEFAEPAISWDPVIAPGSFIFYTGDKFEGWRGQVLLAGMKPTVLVRVGIEGEQATELARYPFERRLREIVQGPNGAIWLLEDKEGGRLLKLSPR